MGLLDEIVAETTPRVRCSVRDMLAALGTEDRDELQIALDQRTQDGAFTYSHALIVRVLGRHGQRIDEKTLRRHRNGQCRCRLLKS